jgi:hypothetical protein
MDILNPLDYPKWDEILLASKGYSFFHTSLWARVLYDSYAYEPCFLTIIRDGKFSMLLPLMEIRSVLTGNRGVSLPFTDYCEPIISSQDDWQNALEFLKVYGKNKQWKYLEFRGGEKELQNPSSSSFYRHTLDLSPDVDAVYAKLKKGTKGSIKKAIKEGVTVTQSNSLGAVQTFYNLHCQTRKRKGVPPQPFNFFQKLYDHVICLGYGQVSLASYQGKIIAGAIYLHFGNEAIYKFSASDNNYLHVQPNNIFMWETIEWYCRNGYKRLCFGRTELYNEGLRAYKKGWGAEEHLILYHRYDLKKTAHVRDSPGPRGFQNKIFARMPIPILKIVGSLLYKHIG